MNTSLQAVIDKHRQDILQLLRQSAAKGESIVTEKLIMGARLTNLAIAKESTGIGNDYNPNVIDEHDLKNQLTMAEQDALREYDQELKKKEQWPQQKMKEASQPPIKTEERNNKGEDDYRVTDNPLIATNVKDSIQEEDVDDSASVASSTDVILNMCPFSQRSSTSPEKSGGKDDAVEEYVQAVAGNKNSQANDTQSKYDDTTATATTSFVRRPEDVSSNEQIVEKMSDSCSEDTISPSAMTTSFSSWSKSRSSSFSWSRSSTNDDDEKRHTSNYDTDSDCTIPFAAGKDLNNNVKSLYKTAATAKNREATKTITTIRKTTATIKAAASRVPTTMKLLSSVRTTATDCDDDDDDDDDDDKDDNESDSDNDPFADLSCYNGSKKRRKLAFSFDDDDDDDDDDNDEDDLDGSDVTSDEHTSTSGYNTNAKSEGKRNYPMVMTNPNKCDNDEDETILTTNRNEEGRFRPGQHVWVNIGGKESQAAVIHSIVAAAADNSEDINNTVIVRWPIAGTYEEFPIDALVPMFDHSTSGDVDLSQYSRRSRKKTVMYAPIIDDRRKLKEEEEVEEEEDEEVEGEYLSDEGGETGTTMKGAGVIVGSTNESSQRKWNRESTEPSTRQHETLEGSEQQNKSGRGGRRTLGRGWTKGLLSGSKDVCWMSPDAQIKFSSWEAARKFEEFRKKFDYNESLAWNEYLQVSAGVADPRFQLPAIHSNTRATNKASAKVSHGTLSSDTNGDSTDHSDKYERYVDHLIGATIYVSDGKFRGKSGTLEERGFGGWCTISGIPKRIKINLCSIVNDGKINLKAARAMQRFMPPVIGSQVAKALASIKRDDDDTSDQEDENERSVDHLIGATVYVTDGKFMGQSGILKERGERGWCTISGIPNKVKVNSFSVVNDGKFDLKAAQAMPRFMPPVMTPSQVAKALASIKLDDADDYENKEDIGAITNVQPPNDFHEGQHVLVMDGKTEYQAVIVSINSPMKYKRRMATVRWSTWKGRTDEVKVSNIRPMFSLESFLDPPGQSTNKRNRIQTDRLSIVPGSNTYVETTIDNSLVSKRKSHEDPPGQSTVKRNRIQTDRLSVVSGSNTYVGTTIDSTSYTASDGAKKTCQPPEEFRRKRGRPCSGIRTTKVRKERRYRDFFDRVGDLKSFKMKHGHLNFSSVRDKQMYNFCYHVRTARRDIISGKRSMMILTKERIAALNAIGFDWKLSPSSVQPRKRGRPSSKKKKRKYKGDEMESDRVNENEYNSLWNYYMEQSVRENEELLGCGIQLRKKVSRCNLLRSKNDVFRRGVHKKIMLLHKEGGRKVDILRILKLLKEYDSGELPKPDLYKFMDEIRGPRTVIDDEVEILDSTESSYDQHMTSLAGDGQHMNNNNFELDDSDSVGRSCSQGGSVVQPNVDCKLAAKHDVLALDIVESPLSSKKVINPCHQYQEMETIDLTEDDDLDLNTTHKNSGEDKCTHKHTSSATNGRVDDGTNRQSTSASDQHIYTQTTSSKGGSVVRPNIECKLAGTNYAGEMSVDIAESPQCCKKLINPSHQYQEIETIDLTEDKIGVGHPSSSPAAVTIPAWECDFCGLKFDDYDVAVTHELGCSKKSAPLNPEKDLPLQPQP